MYIKIEYDSNGVVRNLPNSVKFVWYADNGVYGFYTKHDFDIYYEKRMWKGFDGVFKAESSDEVNKNEV